MVQGFARGIVTDAGKQYISGQNETEAVRNWAK
jgi:hypothetical protein